LRNKEIASRLNITETTVKTHLTRIFQKLNIKARSELISYAIKTDDLNPSQARTSHDF
jgi:DNA-binding NarL/FixJ family response regulator